MNTWIAGRDLMRHYYLTKSIFIAAEECKTLQLKTLYKEFRMNSLGDYHNLYVQSDTLILADVFEKFRDKNIEIYEIDPALIFSAPGLSWQICLKKSGTKLEL